MSASRDVLNHLAGSTHRSEHIGFPNVFEFTAGLGQRVASRATWLDPISMAQFLVGPNQAIWVASSLFISFLLVVLSIVARKLGLSPLSYLPAALFAAVWFVLPSTLRVDDLIDVGGNGAKLAYLLTPLVIVIVRVHLTNGVGISLRGKLGSFLFLTYCFSALSIYQPMLIWAIALSALATVIDTFSETSLADAIRNVTVFALISVLALCTSSLLFTSPIITVLSSSRSEDSREWASSLSRVREPGSQMWVVPEILGNNGLFKGLVSISLVIALLVWFRQKSANQIKVARLFLLLAVVVQAYAIVFYQVLARLELEIGPRPHYLSRSMLLPLLALLVGQSVTTGINWLGSLKVRSHRQALGIRKAKVLVALLPVLYLSVWIVRQPILAKSAFVNNTLVTPPYLSDLPRSLLASDSRTLVVDGGYEFAPGLFLPGDAFGSVLTRRRGTESVVFAEYGLSITKWQKWFFEAYGSLQGRNGAGFLWVRDYNPNLVVALEATHVVSGAEIRDSRLTFLGKDLFNRAFIYKVAMPLSGRLRQQEFVEASKNDFLDGTRIFMESLDGDVSSIVVPTEDNNLVKAEFQEFKIRQHYVEFHLRSTKPSLGILPLEFSRCLSVSLGKSSDESVRLVPINGRFVGIRFQGEVFGKIRFKDFGPKALWCQLNDYWEIRKTTSGSMSTS